MAQSGGQQFGLPNFSDAVPSDPANQGDPGPEGMGRNRVDEKTFESGSYPAGRMAMESNWQGLIDDDGLDGASMDAGNVANKGMGEGIRGYRPQPVGGSYNPGQGKGAKSNGVERSAMSGNDSISY